MKKALTITLVVIGSIVLSALIFGAGLFIGRSSLGFSGIGSTGMPWGKTSRIGMGWFGNDNNPGSSMMGGFSERQGNNYGMGGFQSGNSADVAPLSMDDAKQAVESYLKRLDNSDLELTEIMIFDNNGYARITEKSTGIGAMELLIDPTSLVVYPEYGPNMMWNQKYGHMGGFGGMMGSSGMMRWDRSQNPGVASESMTVTPDQALAISQDYLDKKYPGYQVAEDADPFYGYYTMDILKDGEPTGMLSVNGYSGRVFLHTWHGTFIEMFE